MTTEIIVPSLGESITTATIAKWYKKKGDVIQIDELLLELETEKVTLEVNAVTSGTLQDIFKKEETTVAVGEVIGLIEESAEYELPSIPVEKNPTDRHFATSSPIAHRLLEEHKLDTKVISGTGAKGKIIKSDVLNYIANNPKKESMKNTDRPTERIKMSGLRKTIAQRLKDSQNTAAILTTFNEINMLAIINLREKYQDEFKKYHATKLGFMSFFIKATIEALKQVPVINAEIEGDYIIYKNYYDIGVAVGTEQGLVVPVIQNADTLSFAELEIILTQLSTKAREGQLSMKDLSGGTFSISNGGIYGSLLSTPIINPPQSGILGMHKIEERAVVIGGQIEIRPMMYIALSYDHRIIDGKEAVTFLAKIKEAIEHPEKIFLGLI